MSGAPRRTVVRPPFYGRAQVSWRDSRRWNGRAVGHDAASSPCRQGIAYGGERGAAAGVGCAGAPRSAGGSFSGPVSRRYAAAVQLRFIARSSRGARRAAARSAATKTPSRCRTGSRHHPRSRSQSRRQPLDTTTPAGPPAYRRPCATCRRCLKSTRDSTWRVAIPITDPPAGQASLLSVGSSRRPSAVRPVHARGYRHRERGREHAGPEGRVSVPGVLAASRSTAARRLRRPWRAALDPPARAGLLALNLPAPGG